MSEKVKSFVLLHCILLVYSVSSILSKLASKQEFLSFKFIALYGAVLFILVFYALMWQQVLKRLPLVTAYANKSVTVIWGLIWGVLFFHEAISITKILGILIIMAGVYLVVTGEEKA
ncbi:MAG: transporter [Lachnospiraceae bacterium]|nr:transporter [Lachnospiraceae bacterium]